MDDQIEDFTTYTNTKFADVSLEKRILTGTSFIGVEFDHVNLQFCTLSNCLFQDCVFSNCNCSVMAIDSTQFRKVSFTESKLIGVNWSGAGETFKVRFNGSLLDKSNFFEMNLSKFVFSGCSLRDALFQNTKLNHAVFDKCELARCQFSETDLSFADFSTARNYFIDNHNNKLRKTKFSLPEALSLLGNFDIVLK